MRAAMCYGMPIPDTTLHPVMMGFVNGYGHHIQDRITIAGGNQSSLFRSVFRLRALAVGQPDGAGERCRGAIAVGGT